MRFHAPFVWHADSLSEIDQIFLNYFFHPLPCRKKQEQCVRYVRWVAILFRGLRFPTKRPAPTPQSTSLHQVKTKIYINTHPIPKIHKYVFTEEDFMQADWMGSEGQHRKTDPLIPITDATGQTVPTPSRQNTSLAYPVFFKEILTSIYRFSQHYTDFSMQTHSQPPVLIIGRARRTR